MQDDFSPIVSELPEPLNSATSGMFRGRVITSLRDLLVLNLALNNRLKAVVSIFVSKWSPALALRRKMHQFPIDKTTIGKRTGLRSTG